MTYGEIKTLFANKYEQNSAPSTGAEIRNLFINLAVKNIYDRLRWNWRLKPGTGTTDGTSDLLLAVDFSIDGIKEGTFKIDGEIWTVINEGEDADYGDDENILYFTGNKGEGFYANFPSAVPANGLAVTYRYYRDHVNFTDDAQECIVPKGETVADMAVGMFFQSEGEQEDALPFLESAEGGINEMMKQKNRGQARRTLRNTSNSNIYSVRNMY